MKKRTTKRTAKRSSVSRRRVTKEVSLLSGTGTIWGKDQPMLLLLSAGIVVFIVLGMFLGGWL